MLAAERILITEVLDGESISALNDDKLLAVVVRNFYRPELAEDLSSKILSSSEVAQYTHELADGDMLVQKYFGVDRLGFPFNLTYHAKEHDPLVEQYYREARVGIERMRTLSAPGISPIDKLRLVLDEVYPDGATVAAFEGRKMLAGIGRITKAELSYMSAEQPHFDALPERYAQLDGQLAANIYLKVPDKGGELELWDVAPVNPLSEAPEDWRAVLPQSIKIKPEVGDLVIFNCRRPHAVCEFQGDDRVSVQMFMGYQKDKALLLWN